MNSEIGIGIVGSKFAGGFHAECWAGIRDVRVIAVSSRNPADRFAFMEQHHVARGYETFEEMLRDPDVEVIDICTPNYLHAQMSVSAMKAGKDVICEKPLATGIEEGRKVVEAQRETGRRFFYAEDWIFAPALVRAKAIIAEGGIGRPLYFRAKECHSGSHSRYAQTIAYCGGGCVIHLAVHPIGWLQHLLGAPLTVCGQCSGGGAANLVHHELEGEDWGLGMLTYKDGTHGLVEGNYITAGGMEDSFEVYGSDGVLKVDLTMGSPLSVYSRKGYAYALEKADFTHGWTRPAVDEITSLGYRNELEHFSRCIRGKAEQKPGTFVSDAFDVLRVVDAIYRSSRERRSVDLADSARATA